MLAVTCRPPLLPRAALQAEIRHENRREQERHHCRRDCRAFAQAAAGNRTLERQRCHQVRRVQRSAARQHVDQLEIGEREQHGKGHHDGDDRRQQRQRHVAELLPRRRAVEARRLVIRRRDRLQPGEQRDRDERHAAPDVGGDRREPRGPRLAEEIDVAVDQAHALQRPADDRELRVVDPPERDRRQRRRHDERQQHDRAQERLERQMLVQQQREPQAEAELDDARDDRIEDRVEQREPRDLRRPTGTRSSRVRSIAAAADLRVGESEPRAEAEWIREEQQQQDRRRQQEQQPQRVAVVLEPGKQRGQWSFRMLV
jgi:hypothetical protein